MDRSFFRQDGLTLAKALLGATLCCSLSGQVLRAKIVETESYMGEIDRASHAYGGRRTKRTETMYGDGGRAYVYLIYGRYALFNVVAATKEVPEAVLIRAVEPLGDLEPFYKNRGKVKRSQLTSGPGKLTMALGMGTDIDGLDLVKKEGVWIERRTQVPEMACGPRIGIDYAKEDRDKPWRFFIPGHPDVSKGK